MKNFTAPDAVDIYAIPFSSLQAETFEKYMPKIAWFDMLFNFFYPPLIFVLGFALIATVITESKLWFIGDLLLSLVGLGLLAVGCYATIVIFRQHTYFLLSAEYLVIRYRLPFVKIAVIRLSQIKAVDSEVWTSYRGIDRGDAMLIITSDFKLHTFRMPGRYKSLQSLFDKINATIHTA